MVTAVLVAALAGSAIAPQAADRGATALAFRLEPSVEWIGPALLKVGFELANPSDAAVYVAQFPGPSLSISCATEQGGIGAAAGGAWSNDGTLARKYYIRIGPGEALLGTAVVEVPLDCVRDVRVFGVYQAEDSPAWDLPLAAGRRFTATPLAIDIARRPPGRYATAWGCALQVTVGPGAATAIRFGYFLHGSANPAIPASLRTGETTFGSSLRLVRSDGARFRFLPTPTFSMRGELETFGVRRDTEAFAFVFPDGLDNARLVSEAEWHAAQASPAAAASVYAHGLRAIPPGRYTVTAELPLALPAAGGSRLGLRAARSGVRAFPACEDAGFEVTRRE